VRDVISKLSNKDLGCHVGVRIFDDLQLQSKKAYLQQLNDFIQSSDKKQRRERAAKRKELLIVEKRYCAEK
jgi:hypothetical protein